MAFSTEHKTYIECPMCKDKTFANLIKDIKKNFILTELINENKKKELLSQSPPINQNQNDSVKVTQAQAACSSYENA